MKWLVIILILIVIAAAMVWLRTDRQAGSAEPHERQPADDPTPPPTTLGMRTDTPSTSAGLAYGGDRDVPEEPGSDFAWEPEVTGTDDPKAPDDPPAPGSRPGT